MTRIKSILAAAALTAAAAIPLAFAEEVNKSAEAAYAEMTQLLGAVPTFVKSFPKQGISGAWAEVRDLQFSDTTALDAKTKALIGLAVAAQIPCMYCIYEDTAGRQARRRQPGGNPGSRRHRSAHPPLEHGVLWQPDRF